MNINSFYLKSFVVLVCAVLLSFFVLGFLAKDFAFLFLIYFAIVVLIFSFLIFLVFLLKNSKDQVDCYETLIKQANDPSLCEEVESPAGLNSEKWKSHCLELVSTN